MLKCIQCAVVMLMLIPTAAITQVRLMWSLKDRAALVAAPKELERPRISRKARRAGLVEPLAENCHRLAESLFTAPGMDRTTSEQVSRSDPDLNLPRPQGVADA